MQPLDIGPNGAPIDVALGDDDAIAAGDAHDNALLVRVYGLRLVLVRRIDVQTHLFDEGSRDDEENEHDEHDIQHRREVDLLVRVFLATTERSAHYPYPQGESMRGKYLTQLATPCLGRLGGGCASFGRDASILWVMYSKS